MMVNCFIVSSPLQYEQPAIIFNTYKSVVKYTAFAKFTAEQQTCSVWENVKHSLAIRQYREKHGQNHQYLQKSTRMKTVQQEYSILP